MSRPIRNFRDLIARLDRSLPPHSKTVLEDDSDPLVEAARRLAQGPDVRLTRTAEDHIEARLRQAVAAQRQQRQPTPRVRSSARPIWRQTLRYAAALLLVILLAGTGLTTASANSLPGDPLYSVKRTVEDVRLALSSADGKASLHVDFAERRIDEFQELLNARDEYYPRALAEASGELNRALDLLADGHGSRASLDPQIISLAHQQAQLIERADTLELSTRQQEQLTQIAGDNQLIQDRLATEGSVPDLVPDTTTPTHTPTSAPTETPTPTYTHTPTPTASPTPTPTPTLTPTPTDSDTSAQPSGGSGSGATRTPPGHGPTPGLGDNPPGHGGENPGVGNDGNPPGQGKDKKK